MTTLHDARRVMPQVIVLDDGLFSAGQPTEPQLRALADQGLSAVVNLRGAGEHDETGEQALCREVGVDYRHLPIDGIEELSFLNARRLDAVLAELPRPALIHCASGNRVGALLALRHFQVHGDVESAMSWGVGAGMTGAVSRIRTLLESAAASPSR